MKRSSTLVALSMVASVALCTIQMGCGEKKPVVQPTPMPIYDAAPPPVVDAGPVALAPADGWTGTATRIDPAMAQLASVPLSALAGTEAAGMTPEGTLGAANFAQGQTLEYTFQMVPGKCYTVVGVGAGIQQLDLAAVVVTPLPGFVPQFGINDKKATPVGSQSVLGAKKNCLKLALLTVPVPVKVVATAVRGQGLAAVQLFSK